MISKNKEVSAPRLRGIHHGLRRQQPLGVALGGEGPVEVPTTVGLLDLDHRGVLPRLGEPVQRVIARRPRREGARVAQIQAKDPRHRAAGPEFFEAVCFGDGVTELTRDGHVLEQKERKAGPGGVFGEPGHGLGELGDPLLAHPGVCGFASLRRPPGSLRSRPRPSRR